MDRLLPLAGSFLVAVCVFAWLGGPVLETRFGAEALLTAYAAVAVGAGAVTYAVFRRVDARLSGSPSATNTDPESANGSPSAGSGSPANVSGAAPSTADTGTSGEEGTANADADGKAGSGDTESPVEGEAHTASEGADRSARPQRSGSLAELEALSIAAEVERLKQDRDRSE